MGQAARGMSATPAAFGQLRIASQPAGAQVLFDGQPQEVTPVTVTRIAPGTHLLVIRKEGYIEARRAIALLAGQKAAVELTLDPLTGLLLIHSKPSGAEAEVDGSFRGKTPLLLTDLTAGEHRLRLRAEGFVPRPFTIKVTDRIPQKIQADLTSDAARLTITSEPAGASVDVNGARRGVTPCTVERVAAGDSEVLVILEGYESYRGRVATRAGETLEVRAVLKAIPATLEVLSLPKSARIYLNDQFSGETPLTRTNMAPGECRIRAELPGYETDARTVLIKPAAHNTEEFRLVRNSGVLTIITEPAGCNVFVDGVLRGTTRPSAANEAVSDIFGVDNLSTGEHKVQLVKSGYRDKQLTVKADTAQTVNLHESMARIFIPNVLVRIAPDGAITRTGMLIAKRPNGDVELETHPGIFMLVPAADVLSVETYNVGRK